MRCTRVLDHCRDWALQGGFVFKYSIYRQICTDIVSERPAAIYADYAENNEPRYCCTCLIVCVILYSMGEQLGNNERTTSSYYTLHSVPMNRSALLTSSDRPNTAGTAPSAVRSSRETDDRRGAQSWRPSFDPWSGTSSSFCRRLLMLLLLRQADGVCCYFDGRVVAPRSNSSWVFART